MTRREALAALIVFPAALLAVPPQPPMGKVARLCMKATASVAEFEQQLAAIEAKLERTGHKIGHCDEMTNAFMDAIERGDHLRKPTP